MVKSYLWSQLSDVLYKSITGHNFFMEIWDAIKLLASMVEMACGLPYMHEDHTTAINVINGQLER